MRLPPKAPFILFTTGQGTQVKIDSGSRCESARLSFAAIVTRLHKLAEQTYWPGNKLVEPGLPRPDQTQGAMACQCPQDSKISRSISVCLSVIVPEHQPSLIYRMGDTRVVTWIGMTDDQLGPLCIKACRWMANGE